MQNQNPDQMKARSQNGQNKTNGQNAQNKKTTILMPKGESELR